MSGGEVSDSWSKPHPHLRMHFAMMSISVALLAVCTTENRRGPAGWLRATTSAPVSSFVNVTSANKPVRPPAARHRRLARPDAGAPSRSLAPAPSGVQTAPASRSTVADHRSDRKDGAYGIQDDALRVCRGGQLVDPRLGPSQTTPVRELLMVRDAARAALRAQLDGAGR
jgi:hypothetical protein